MAQMNPLIAALRAASSPGAANPGIRLYANTGNGIAVTPYNYTGMAFNPPILLQTPGSTRSPSGGGGGGGGGDGGGTRGGGTDTRRDVIDVIDTVTTNPDIVDVTDVVDNDPVIDDGPDIVDGPGDVTDTIIDTGLVIDDPVVGDTSNTDPLELTDRIDNDFIDRLNGIDFGELDPPIDSWDREGIVEINQDNVDYDGYSSFEDPNSVDAVNGADLESDLYGIYDDEEFLKQLEKLNSQDSGGSGDPSSNFWNWNRLYGVDAGGGFTDLDLLEMLADK